jgi:hypothetical protein
MSAPRSRLRSSDRFLGSDWRRHRCICQLHQTGKIPAWELRRRGAILRWVDARGAASPRHSLVVYNRVGLNVEVPFQAPLNESNNLVFDNLANVYTPSISDLTVDPMLNSRTDLRLRAGSPAINAANSLGTLDAYAVAGIGLVDGDGLRRFKATQADVGAHEFGDISLRARADAPSGNAFAVNHAAINGNADARLFATIDASLGFNPPAIGVYFAGGRWRIFYQDLQAMPVGLQFNLFVAGDGSGNFVHTAAPANLSGHLTTIDNAALNNLPNRIVLATPNWNPGGAAGVYNNHTTSVGYFSPSWFVLNNDFGAISVGAAFNIYSQDPSPNAFVHTAAPGNSVGQWTILDHPLINGISCALIHVTPLSGAHGDTSFDVYFDAATQRWYLFNHDLPMAPGASFNVVIDAAQVDACTNAVFSDGFED